MIDLFSKSHPIRLSAKAIVAGSLVAISIHLLLTMLGAGITALAVKPSASDTPVQSYTLGVAIAWTLSAFASLWIGGCVAGKIGTLGDTESGKLHGLVVWSLTTVIAFIMLAAGVGKSLNLAGQAIAGTAKAGAQLVAETADKSSSVVKEYSTELKNNGQPLTPAGTREIAMNLKNLLVNEGGRTEQNKQALITSLSTHAGVNPQDAAKTVDEWTASYDRAVKEVKDAADVAAAKTRDAADAAAKVTGATAVWTFIAFWIGAVLAAHGGKSGALGCHKESPDVHDGVNRTVP